MPYTQVFLNGILAASVYAMVGTGFALIYSTGRFFHFAHGALFTAAGYFTLLFAGWIGMPLSVSVVGAVGATSLLGCCCEVAVYRPLRRNGASALALLAASLGIFIVLQNVIAMLFGDEVRILRSQVVVEAVSVLGVRATPIQWTTVCVFVALVPGLAVLLRTTAPGRLIRAVANDATLARMVGIDVEHVMLWTFSAGSALVGIAGILVALDSDLKPTMGMRPLLMGIVAAMIGGVNSITGVALGAILLGVAQQFGVWTLPMQWQDCVAFAILLVFLVLRPQGMFGRPAQGTIT